MRKSDIPVMPKYYDRYINLVPDVELSKAFDESIQDLEALDKSLLETLQQKNYEPGKWTVNEIFQHLIDTERIFNYRTLLFARDKGAISPGFDQDLYVKDSKANRRHINHLINELNSVRISTKTLFESFDNETLLNTGVSWDIEVSILAMGFMLIGHQKHHFNVIKEKYYPINN